jgi:anti-anti-sigma factor
MKKDSIELKISKRTGIPSTLTIKGDLTYEKVPGIKVALGKKIDKLNQLDLELKETEFLDLTGVQLLYSIKKTIQANGGKITVNHTMNENSLHLLKNAGLSGIILNK